MVNSLPHLKDDEYEDKAERTEALFTGVSPYMC